MEIGIKNRVESTVTQELSAKTMGSGSLDVFATPAMVALMEKCAAESVESLVGEGNSTVGTKIDVDHLSATPLGMKVYCESELIAEDGRSLTFKIEAFDEAGLIGRATHNRFVIAKERFVEKTYQKLSK